jgi:hypothetical protein
VSEPFSRRRARQLDTPGNEGLPHINQSGPEERTAQSSSGTEASPEAKKLAAAILEVLAGVRGPSEAAKLLDISLARYYQLETRALAGLLVSCEPRRRRGGRRPANELAALRQECEQLRRECVRQQSLVRIAQRTVGLAAPSPVPSGPTDAGKKRRKRRPTARALKVAALLQGGSESQKEQTENSSQPQSNTPPETEQC